MKKPIRFQFSIATLLALVAVSAVAAHWSATKCRVALAEETLDAARSGYNAGVKSEEAIFRASVDLLHAQLAVPFCDRKAAFSAHIERMTVLEQNIRNLPLVALVGGDPGEFRRECDEKANEIFAWCKEGERWRDEAFPK